jgi:nucleoside-diphosphate-sugar epimerase
MSTCLITGGAGFLGSHLSEHLLGKDHRVICVDNLDTGSLQNIEHIREADFVFLQHDLTEPFFVEEPVDFVYHLASPASPIDYARLPLHTLKVGSYGTHHMLGLAKLKRARFLLASTSEVYGDPAEHPQEESYWGHVNPIGPRSCYDEGKRCAETLFFDYYRQHALRVKVARIFNTYGPKMLPNDGRVVSSFIVQALQGEPLTIFGDGSQTRSFCYVDDLVDGLILLMETGDDVTGPINLGNPGEFTMLELATKVIEMVGNGTAVEHRPLPEDDPVRRCPDIDQARKVLGWEPTVGLDEGLSRTVEYFRSLLPA